MNVTYEVVRGNCWEFIKTLEDNFVDTIITDPMYDDKNINMDELRRICKGHIIMFCDPRHRFFEPDEVAIWKKPESSKNNSKHLSCFFEEILIERHGNIYNHDLESVNYTGIYYDTLLEARKHPFQKPISLMERLIRIYSNPNDLVFDPFCGSESTLKAALRQGRRGLGCEVGKYD